MTGLDTLSKIKCDVGAEYKESSSALYQAYRNYCLDTNEYVRSTADFYFAAGKRWLRADCGQEEAFL